MFYNNLLSEWVRQASAVRYQVPPIIPKSSRLWRLWWQGADEEVTGREARAVGRVND